MPFEIIRGDITELNVDAIVNAANPNPVIGYGVDAGIHQKAVSRLLEARQMIGPIPVGQAALTRGFNLAAKYVIHAVGPATGEKRICSARPIAAPLPWRRKNGVDQWRFPCCPRGIMVFPKALRFRLLSARSVPF